MSKARLNRITGARTLTSYDMADLLGGNYTKVLIVYVNGVYTGFTNLK